MIKYSSVQVMKSWDEMNGDEIWLHHIVHVRPIERLRCVSPSHLTASQPILEGFTEDDHGTYRGGTTPYYSRKNFI
jgi:hypothetical protein